MDSTPDAGSRKILICEEALIDHKGHFFTWIRAIRQMHLNAGVKVFVAGSAKVIPDLKKALEVIPAYSVNSWKRTGKSNIAWRYLTVFWHNFRILRETRLLLKQVGPVDTIFFTAVRVDHLLGLRALCLWGLKTHFQKMVFFILTSQADYNSDFTEFHFSKRSELIRWAIKSFGGLVAKKRVIIAGDSHITCKEYERLAGVPMTLFPSPGVSLHYGRSNEINHTSTSKDVVFTFLGVSTYDKGIDILQNAILELFEKFPNITVRFVIQWGVATIRPDGSMIKIDQRLRESARVTFLERSLTEEEYAKFFGETDFIVLPYRKMTYVNRISGVAVEAACSGKPMIVTKNTWLSWALTEFGAGLEVAEDDVIGLTQALIECIKRSDELKLEAKQRMALALAYNSNARYLELLWK